MKAIAIFLGPSGLGILNLFQSSLTLVSTVSGLGISDSGVREIAEADGNADEKQVDRIRTILKRVALITGLLGWLLVAALAYPISQLTFGDISHTKELILLGSCLLLSSVGASYSAILQGTRQIGKLAKLRIVSTAAATIIAIILFATLGIKAIVPSMIASATAICAISWRIGRKTDTSRNHVSWTETFFSSKKMLKMGSAFMWNAVSTGLVAFGIRAMIVRYEGLEANGIFQAAWAISGMFAAFIIQAMATDFYPRLTSAAQDPKKMNRLVNEQTEIGLLLAGPGVLFTLCLAPLLMESLYSAAFKAGTPIVCWFVVGVFGQIISWPLGFIQIARGATRSFIITQTIFNGLHFALSALFFRYFGMIGIGAAYVVLYLFYTVGMAIYMNRVTGFTWNMETAKLIVVISIMVLLSFSLAIMEIGLTGFSLGALLTFIGSFFCFRELLNRLPDNNRLTALLRRIPGIQKNKN